MLSADYFSIPEEEIRGIESVLTVVGGKVVYGEEEFAGLAPPQLPASPDWSPVGLYNGYHHEVKASAAANKSRIVLPRGKRWLWKGSPLWGIGCDCFAY